MIIIVGAKQGCKMYLDSKGIDEMISYFQYLKDGIDSECDLIIGNELDELEEDDIVPEGYEQVNLVEIINVDAYKNKK